MYDPSKGWLTFLEMMEILFLEWVNISKSLLRKRSNSITLLQERVAMIENLEHRETLLFFFFGELRLFDRENGDEVVKADSDLRFIFVLKSCLAWETKMSLLTTSRSCVGNSIESDRVEAHAKIN